MESGAELVPISAQDASVLSLKQRQQWLFLEMLIPSTSYEVQVRVKAQRNNTGTWSPWSQPLTFRTRPAGTVGGTGWGWVWEKLGKGKVLWELQMWVSLLPPHLPAPPVGSLTRDRDAQDISHGHRW